MSVDFKNKLILAPMVRMGTLGYRLLAIHCGAEMVFTEELIDRKLMRTERKVNEERNTVEYVYREERGKKNRREIVDVVVFSTLWKVPEDRKSVPLVLQLGTNSAETALAAAKHVEKDVDAIDINMGCPKAFSVKGGMGVALLRDSERLEKILRTLVENLSIPVTCKIRFLENREETLKRVRGILNCGVSAVTIHPRVPDARNEKVPADYTEMKECLEIIRQERGGKLDVSVIVSGDIFERDKVGAILSSCGADSVMFARGAMHNVSVFSGNCIPKLEYAKLFIQYSIYYSNPFGNVKYALQRIFKAKEEIQFYNMVQYGSTYEQILLEYKIGRTYEECKQSLPDLPRIPLGDSKPPPQNTESCSTKHTRGDLEDDTCQQEEAAKKQKFDDAQQPL